MRKCTVALLSAAALAMGAVPAAAKQETPGTPFEPGCEGQSTAFLAQSPMFGGPGFANAAKSMGMTPKELHALIREECATGIQ